MRTTLLTFLGLSLSAELASAQLIHRYGFDGVGAVALDSIGGAHGSVLGGAALAGTGAVALDGVDDHVRLPGGLVSSFTDATFEAWATWDGSTSWQRILDFGDNSGGPGGQGVGNSYLVLAARDNVQLVPTGAMRTMAGTTSLKVYANSLPPAGTLVHYALVFDGTNDSMSLYVDGVLQNTTPITLELTALLDVNCYLGRSQFTQDPHFLGSIEEFRVYRGARSAAQLAASYAAGPDVTDAGTNYCGPAAPNSTGQNGSLVASGSASASLGVLSLIASRLPNNAFGFFLTSQAQGFVQQPGGSQGNLCLSGAIGRYVGPGQIKNSGASGAFSLVLDLAATPQPTGLVTVTAGQTWNFQCWHRDAVGGNATSNFTDASAVAFL
jgi:hypothetical protein